MISVQCL